MLIPSPSSEAKSSRVSRYTNGRHSTDFLFAATNNVMQCIPSDNFSCYSTAGQFTYLDDDIDSVEVIAGVFKHVLNDMPNPLFPYDVYKPLVKLGAYR